MVERNFECYKLKFLSSVLEHSKLLQIIEKKNNANIKYRIVEKGLEKSGIGNVPNNSHPIFLLLGFNFAREYKK